jgi:hypothetical protein
MEIIARTKLPLSDKELEILTKLVGSQEYYLYYPSHWLSGAWSKSNVTFIGRKIIRVTIQYGVHNESTYWTEKERYDVNRETMKFMEE